MATDIGVEEWEERREGCVRVRTVGEEAEELPRSLEFEDGIHNEGVDEGNASDVYKSKPAVSSMVRTSCRQASLTYKGIHELKKLADERVWHTKIKSHIYEDW
jgi:hypothetical protein